MRVIAKKILREFWNKYTDSEEQLKTWYKEASRAPVRRPRQISAQQQQAIVLTPNRLETQRFAQTGVSAIKWELSKQGLHFPSDSTINRVLKREGLVKKNSIHPKRGRISIFQRSTWV